MIRYLLQYTAGFLISLLWGVLMLNLGWSLFVVPVLGLDPLTVKETAGLFILIAMFTAGSNK